MSNHPNLFDHIAVKIYPRYLYPGQFCQTIATTNVGIIHKLPDIHNTWRVMDYLYLQKGSYLRYLGLAKRVKVFGEIDPNSTILELVEPVVDESKSFGKHASPRDLICISPFDRQFIASATGPALNPISRLGDLIAPTPGN